ncbi:MAG: 2-hydroxyacid dehydrogenase [Solirubrobacterales bacterium]
MTERHVAVTYDASPEERAVFLEVLADDVSLEFAAGLSPEQRRSVLEKATALLAWNFPREIAASEYDRLDRVELIQLLSAGVDHMPFEDLPPHIAIAGNVGAYALPMAEHTMGMILALAKRLCVESEKLKHGRFDQHTPTRLLSGMTAGILGFGGIGRATSRLMRSFGMRIHAINTTGTSSEPADFIGTLDDLAEVLAVSDVVVVALPLTRATHRLIGEEELCWMKPNAILINVSRAAILDEEALYRHVKDHPDFLLGIDAWWTEPFMEGSFRLEYPFLDLPNVLGSPHNSAIVAGGRLIAARHAAENIRRFIRGERAMGIVRREDYLQLTSANEPS